MTAMIPVAKNVCTPLTGRLPEVKRADDELRRIKSFIKKVKLTVVENETIGRLENQRMEEEAGQGSIWEYNKDLDAW